ncbi:MAG: inovirus-type Gp2 protein [Pseudomonadales bacterium]|nr:inovirus-type Gp2 protein [Pseudomonadales bacterium]
MSVEQRGTWYLNALPSGIQTVMMRKIIEQIDAMLSYHSKVIAIRWDLHQPSYTPNNQRMSVFLRRLKKRLQTVYRIKRLGYVWARESATQVNQHYHFMVLLDGQKIKHSNSVFHIAREIWADMGGSSCSLPENPFYKIYRGDDLAKSEVIYRASYLAKSASKGKRPAQTKDYSTSRLLPKQH